MGDNSSQASTAVANNVDLEVECVRVSIHMLSAFAPLHPWVSFLMCFHLAWQ